MLPAYRPNFDEVARTTQKVGQVGSEVIVTIYSCAHGLNFERTLATRGSDPANGVDACIFYHHQSLYMTPHSLHS